MNFSNLQEAIWRTLGYHETTQRRDWERQEIRDALNECLMELSRLRPYLWGMVAETSIAIVAGTDTYEINDWCLRPISFYTTDQAAHKVAFRHPQNADRDGSRNSNLVWASNGPWQLTWKPHANAAALSGLAASISEAGTAVTGLSGLGVADAYVNRLIRFKGEDNDYKITAHTNTTATIDKAHKGTLTGLGTSGAASNYSSVKWEIGPPQRYRLQILPSPTEARTMYVRYARRPRRLILDDDTPEIPEEFHNVLWRGALTKISFAKKDADYVAAGQQIWTEAKRELMAHDDAEIWDEDDSAFYHSSLNNHSAAYVPGAYHRGL